MVAQGFIVLQFYGSMNPDTSSYCHLPINSCIQNPGIHGSVVPWFHGSMFPCFYESMHPHFHGSLVPWIHDSVVLETWIHGTTELLIHWIHVHDVAVLPWFHDSMFQWFHDSVIPETWIHGTAGLCMYTTFIVETYHVCIGHYGVGPIFMEPQNYRTMYL